MKVEICFVYKIATANGRIRIHDTRFTGVVDDDGKFKVSSCCGHIYSELVVGSAANNSHPAYRIIRDIA